MTAPATRSEEFGLRVIYAHGARFRLLKSVLQDHQRAQLCRQLFEAKRQGGLVGFDLALDDCALHTGWTQDEWRAEYKTWEDKPENLAL